LFVALIKQSSPVAQAQQSRRFFGAAKQTVRLDPFSNIPEADLPFDRYFYLRKYVRVGDPDLNMAYMVNVDKNGDVIFRKKDRGVLPTVKTEVYPITDDKTVDPKVFKAFDILVSPLKPHNGLLGRTASYNMSLSSLALMSPGRLNDYARAILHLHLNEQRSAKTIVDSIELVKQRTGDMRLVSMKELKTYYNTHLRAELEKLGALDDDGKKAKAQAIIMHSLDNQELIVSPDLGRRQLMFVFYDQAPGDIFLTTQVSRLDTRAGTYIQPDFGAIYYGFGGGEKGIEINPSFRGVTPYLGVNLLFRPFDADIPLRDVRQHHKLKFYQRFSLQAGLTLSSLAKDRYRANLFGSFNPMFGIGYRLSSTFKVHVGTVLYRKLDPNPLLDNPSMKPIGYAGISIDLRIREVLKDVGKLFTPTGK